MTTTVRTSAALPRQALPTGILFSEEQDGIYWLRGEDLKRAKRLLGFCCEGDSIGFDAESAGYHIKALLDMGEQVGILRGSTVQPVVLRGSGDSAKVKSTNIGLAPQLVFGLRELERLRRGLTRKHSPLRETVERMRAEFARGNDRAVSEIGAIYVYRVAQNMYEVDGELTSVPQAVVEALAVAAHLAGRMLRCQLVEPKARRGKKSERGQPKIVMNEPVTYGQLRFAL